MLFKLLKKPLFKRWSKIVLLTGIFLGIFFFVYQNYQIKNIAVQLDDQQTIIGLSDYKKRLSFLLDEKKIMQDLQRKNPDLIIVFTKINYPDALTVKIKKNPGVALLKNNQGYFTLGSSGIIIRKDKTLTSNLPLINYYQKLDYLSYHPGERIDFADLVFCLSFISAVQNLGLQINSIDIQGTTMLVLNLNNQKKIVVNPEKKVGQLQAELEAIIKQLKIRGTDFSQLDLRFNKPVIIF